jgi:hypothetical protein
MSRGRILVLAALLASLASPAAAQSVGTSRVAAERATLHARCDASSPSRAVLKRGEVVDVEAVSEGWVSVRVVAGGEQGCLRRAELEPTQAIDRAGAARRTREIARARGESPRPAPASPTGRPLHVAVYGTAGLFLPTAKDSFDAILDKTSGLDFGAGAQIAWQSGRLGGLFVGVDVSRFEETGQRVFVHEGEVFPLGIPLTLTLTPLEVTAGYRVAPTRRRGGRVEATPVAYFAGGGVGTVGYTESDDDGDVSERFTSYHVMGGADVTVWGPLQIGAEARYRWVPDGLGAGGVSDAFNETDLGGATIRVRIGVAF